MCDIEKYSKVLSEPKSSIQQRFSALFELKSIGNELAVKEIVKIFSDDSALLKHELAYVLGQMQNQTAIPYLRKVLDDESQPLIVRHEAAEALAAVGDNEWYEKLVKYRDSEYRVLRETCILASDMIEWRKNNNEQEINNKSPNPFQTVDPAPPFIDNSVECNKNILLDASIFDRYRAMFSLRNMKTEIATKYICEAFKCDGSLLKHEVAYVLGQLSDPISIKPLMDVLNNEDEDEMVRHEAAEALGNMLNAEVIECLQKLTNHTNDIIRESCILSLEM
ncbi:hypothetical protein A3Q56_00146 [Intoshia linei]|uniref:Deoxyhypusine hydroxylase n=1 Tax=Intoshia linei TaxID=1819745 RepID=A0A177BCW1_9BILA|nr:hypothetical protein A3Q56_00146 [Intoshia linei]